MKQDRKHYRQGDVLVRRLDGELPEKSRRLPRDDHARVVLAHGERTGHAHALRDPLGCAYSLATESELELLMVWGSGAELRHGLVSGAQAEHASIALPPGLYEVAVQVEYTPVAALRTVTD